MKHFVITVIALTLLLVTASSPLANASVKLPRLVSNGMVLQRDVPLKIWGWANPAEKITVNFLGKVYPTKADKNGNWMVTLPATPAGGPFRLKINEIELTDILIGDVWLCSGQSNMELPIRRVLDRYKQEIDKVNNPYIRQFRVPLRYEFRLAKTDYESGAWVPATPENILDFSAVAYFFAAELYRKNGVPVGLINSAVGGSPAQAWLSKNTLKKYPEYLQAAEQCANPAYVDSIKAVDNERSKNWHAELNRKDPGTGRWSKPSTDISDWPEISLPGYWNEKNVTLKNGSVWFCKYFGLTEELAGEDATLRLGCIVDADSVFVNGHFVGNTTYQYPPRIYRVPGSILKAGQNRITVRVISQSGKGGFVPEKPYELRFAHDTIDLSGDWHYQTGAEMPASQSQTFFQYKPGGLYNGMIHPLLNYRMKGAIWYQGESNTGKPQEYRQLFQDLILDWRSELSQPEWPFLFVQLANLGLPQMQPVESGWAEVRDAQRRALELPMTGMAVTFDIGEWNDIHPLNKKEVGRRLFLEAERVAYQDTNVVSSGPLFQSMTVNGNSIILSFKSTGSGLDANSQLKGFQVAGADGRFVWANAVVLNKNTVKVWSPQVNQPTAVRYAWEDNPANANLKNKEGLPASPFTTEK